VNNPIVRAILVLLLPTVAFASGVRIMSSLSDRAYVVERLATAPAKDRPPLNQRPGYDLPAVGRHWGAMDAAALRLERRFLLLDLVFPLLYGGALVVSLLLAWDALGRSFYPLWVVLPVVAGMLADWTENVVHLCQLRRFVASGASGLQAGWIQVASAATILKLLLLAGSSLLLVTLTGIVLARLIRKT
jgi:hypothetical protein